MSGQVKEAFKLWEEETCFDFEEVPAANLTAPGIIVRSFLADYT